MRVLFPGSYQGTALDYPFRRMFPGRVSCFLEADQGHGEGVPGVVCRLDLPRDSFRVSILRGRSCRMPFFEQKRASARFYLGVLIFYRGTA